MILKGMLYVILSFFAIYAVIMFILWIVCLRLWHIYKPIKDTEYYKLSEKKNISNTDGKTDICKNENTDTD